MENKKNTSTFGYIEGYYGHILNWSERKLVVKSLSENKMNTYFYAPKEDLKHRLNWRSPYGENWRNNFRDFANFSKKNKVNIIAGIAPGLDFNFQKFKINCYHSKNSDFNLLLTKSQQLLQDGASYIALLLDDIPDDYNKKHDYKISEGTNHAFLANELSKYLKHYIYFVPRIYANELVKESPHYLSDLGKVINKDIKVFYCGTDVVSKTIKLKDTKKLNKILDNNIIYWDNYYANDYCPRRLFLGPWKGRKGIENVLINLTGMIQTDLMIIDIVANTINLARNKEAYKKALKKNNIPKEFLNLIKFFNNPNYNEELKETEIEVNKKVLYSIDIMLWEWKSKIALEWYPYLLGLKHDLQLKVGVLTSDRIIKTQTSALSSILLKNKWK